MEEAENRVDLLNVRIDRMADYFPRKLFVVELSPKPESRAKE